MAEYDDTNRGATFRTFEDMELILQGKINADGRDAKVAIVKRQSRDGNEILEVYEKIGAIFPNQKTKDSGPDYTGMIYKTDDKQSPWTDPHKNKRVAAWRQMKGDRPYLAFKVSDPQERPSSPQDRNDEIPF